MSPRDWPSDIPPMLIEESLHQINDIPHPGLINEDTHLSNEIPPSYMPPQLTNTKRHNLIQELFVTEKNYYSDLQALCELRTRLQPNQPSQSPDILSNEEYDFLFDATFEKILLCSQLLVCFIQKPSLFIPTFTFKNTILYNTISFIILLYSLGH